MEAMRIGMQMYTLRDFCKNEKDIAATFAKLRKIGFKYIQISGMAPVEPKTMRTLMDDHGIVPVSTHTGYEAIINQGEKVIEAHLMYGCNLMVCPGLPMELHNAAGYRNVADQFAKAMPRFAAKGLALGYHNHGMELERYDGKAGLEILLDGCPSLFAEIDTYWVQYGGGDPAAWIARYPDRVIQIHVKDMGMHENKQVMPPIGTGNLNWPRILSASAKAGVQYLLIEMDEPTIEPFESARISLENLKKMGCIAE